MSEFKAGKKIEIRTLDDARPFVGMRARLEFEGRLRGEGPISLTTYYVRTRPDGEAGSHDSGAIVPGRACTLTLLGTEAENLRVTLAAAAQEADKTREKHAAIRRQLLEAEEREAREAKEKARAEALAEESARFPLPEGCSWERSEIGSPQLRQTDTWMYIDACGEVCAGTDAEYFDPAGEEFAYPLTAVRAVIARYDAENPPKVEKPAGYDLDVKGLPSRDIVDRFPEILDGDVVRLTLTDGRDFIRKLKVGPKRYDTTVSYRDIMGDRSTWVSGGSAYGVSKITFLHRDAAATAPKVEGYDIDVAGRYCSVLGYQNPEILDGDIVELTLHDGSRVTRTIALRHDAPFTSTPFSIEDGYESKIVSGTHGYGVRRIALVRRAEEPYSVQLDGLAMDDVDHEFEEGDRVLLTHEDGRETEHTILTLFPDGDCSVRPHCGHEWTQDVVNCSYKGVVKITRLEASARA